MAVTPTDLSVYQGDDHGWTVTVRNADGTPADITGHIPKAQIRRAVADADPVVVAEMTATVESPLVYLSVSNAQTVAMNGRYVWDLQLTSPAGIVTTINAGKVQAKAEVTRVEVAMFAEMEVALL